MNIYIYIEQILRLNSYSYGIPKMSKNYDLAHTKSNDFTVYVYCKLGC